MAEECSGGKIQISNNEITPEMYGEMDGILDQYRERPGSLIPVLQKAQGVCGYLPAEVQRYIAEGLNISPSQVFGVVSFYSFFTMKPRGKYTVRVCLGTACYVKRSDEIIEKLKGELKVEVGGITEDRMFSLEAVRCLGACGLAPVAVVGEDTYGLLDPVKALGILKKYREEEKGNA
jgi:NADH-quinone oxidoreductase subunit E/NADP-reducing hydrogenase subunit HndA